MKQVLNFILNRPWMVIVMILCLANLVTFAFQLNIAGFLWCGVATLYYFLYNVSDDNRKELRKYNEEIASKLNQATDINSNCNCRDCMRKRGILK